jgi:hypothetical protein
MEELPIWHQYAFIDPMTSARRAHKTHPEHRNRNGEFHLLL